MDFIDWVLLKMYAWQNAVLIVMVPLFLASLAGAIYVTREAYFKRTVLK
jgi:hypothetical protein